MTSSTDIMTDAGIESLHNLDLNRFYLIYNTVHKMMADRGYTPLETKLTKKKWISQFLGYLAELDDEESELDVFGMLDNITLLFKLDKKLLLVYFLPLDSKLAQNDMTYIHNLMNEKKAQQLVIVANNKATPKVTNVLGILGHRAQLFTEDELVHPCITHQLVPKHVLLKGNARERVLNSFGKLSDGEMHLEVLPGMFTTDAIAKYYNFKVDDLIEIKRPRFDGFDDISYRIVTHPVTDKEKGK